MRTVNTLEQIASAFSRQNALFGGKTTSFPAKFVTKASPAQTSTSSAQNSTKSATCKNVVVFGGCVEDIIAKIGAKSMPRSSNPGACVDTLSSRAL